MKRLAKYLAIAALVLALLLTAGGWMVSGWLQSPETHAAIEGKISDALHLPVKIESLGFSAWSGITAKKISVTGPDGVLFEAARLSAGHRFASLLRGNIGLSEVRIEQPHFRLVQDASGKWAMPRTDSPRPPILVAPVAPLQSAAPTPPTIAAAPNTAPPAPPAQPETAAPPAVKPDKIYVGKIIIEGATAELIDKSHAPFATVSGMNVTLRDVTENAFNGNFSAEHMLLHGWFSIENMSGLTTREAGEFQIRKLTAAAGGGSITGEATFLPGATGAATLKLDGINLDRAAQNAGANARKIAGVLGGDAQFTGIGADPKTLIGRGALSLKGGDCSQFEVLRQLGETLRVAEIANFQIADLSANFQVANAQMILGPAEISAPPAGITLGGPIGFDGALNITALLHLPANLVERQGAMLSARFTPPDARAQRSLQFAITGTLAKPRQNLAESLTGTKDRREQRVIGAATAISSILERTNVGKKNPKLMQLLPQLIPVKPAPTPVPQPAPPAPAQP